MRISDWSSDGGSSDLGDTLVGDLARPDRPPNDGVVLVDDIDIIALVVAQHRRFRQERSIDRAGHDHGAGEAAGPQIRPVKYGDAGVTLKIGRASCRERVCQYV